MLVSFKVSNFLSINSEQTLNLFPSRVTSHKGHKFKTKTTQVDILKSAIIYGPNSAGKSNLFKAINFARNFIVKGSKNKNFIDVPIFKLNKSEDSPSQFVFEINAESNNYEYGFEIKNSIIEKEWLTKVYKTLNDVPIFERNLINKKPEIIVSFNITDKQKQLVINSTKAELKNNQLFLTILNSKNKENIENIFKIVFNWFDNILTVVFPDSMAHGIQLGIMKKKELNKFFDEFLNSLDTGIDKLCFHSYSLDDEFVTIPKDLKIEIKNDLDEDTELITVSSNDGFERFCIERIKGEFIAHKLKAVHLNKNNKEIEFDFREESDGTNRIFNLIPALSMLIKSNKVVLIDEIDRSLHSLIPAKIFEYFFKETKDKASQIIASTHDINLLDLKKFRRDEIWFIRKNAKFESEIYSLEEFKTRFDKGLCNAYLSGVYGAIPILD